MLCNQKAVWGRKGFFPLTLHDHSSSVKEDRAGVQDRNLEAAARWLALLRFLSLLSYGLQDHWPRDDTTHSGPGPLLQSLKKKMPHS